MEKVRVFIDWCDKNFVASCVSEKFGALIVTDKTEQHIKERFEDAFEFHTEGKLKASFIYDYSVSAKMQVALQYITLTALRRMTGIKHAQLSHYANATSVPKKPQYDKIMGGLHSIGKIISTI